MNLESLSAQNYEEIFDKIVELKIPEEQIRNFLLDLNEANMPTNAFIGAISSLKKRMKTINAPQNAIDVCGTGGDKLNTLNVSTAVSFVVAAAGVPVAKHGNKAISSNSGSADIFSELGIKISDDLVQIEKDLHEKKLSFLFAPFFHESLKNVAQIRKSLGVPTIFNFLGPLLNPANTKKQIIGVSRRDIMHKMAKCLSIQSPQTTAYFVHGFDGMDEITLTDNSYLLRCEKGIIFPEEIINPEEFGFKKVSLDQLKGKDPSYNAKKLKSLLEGEQSAYRDIVILNSAFALKLAERVSSIEEGIELSSRIISTKAAIPSLIL